jgi:hypothetical protein
MTDGAVLRLYSPDLCPSHSHETDQFDSHTVPDLLFRAGEVWRNLVAQD